MEELFEGEEAVRVVEITGSACGFRDDGDRHELCAFATHRSSVACLDRSVSVESIHRSRANLLYDKILGKCFIT